MTKRNKTPHFATENSFVAIFEKKNEIWLNYLSLFHPHRLLKS